MESKQQYDPDRDSLLCLAEFLAPALVEKLAPMNVRHYTELLKAANLDVSDEIAAELQLEEVIFSLHLVSRLAHAMLIPEKRDYFMDATVSEAREIVSQRFESGMEATAFCESFGTLYNKRQEEYASWRFSGEDSSKGELFWEHAKQVLFRVTNVNVVLLAMFERSGLQTCKFLADFLDKNLAPHASDRAEQDQPLDKYGVYRDEAGALRFDLTEEEQSEVRTYFKIFKDYAFKPEAADDFSRELTAYALSGLAHKYFNHSQEQNAIYTASKAASISHVPIYTFELALVFETVGMRELAKMSCGNFLKMMSVHTPSEMDKLFEQRHNLEEAIEVARQIIDS